jgi:hypothetical protein
LLSYELFLQVSQIDLFIQTYECFRSKGFYKDFFFQAKILAYEKTFQLLSFEFSLVVLSFATLIGHLK